MPPAAGMDNQGWVNEGNIIARWGFALSCWIGLDRGIRSMLGTDIGHNSNSDSRSYLFGLEGILNMSSVIESCRIPILGPLGEQVGPRPKPSWVAETQRKLSSMCLRGFFLEASISS